MPRRSIGNQIGEEPIEVLARRPSQAKRNREWERSQREKANVVSYRGVPVSLSQQITKIAGELGVPVGDVARSFLEYGLQGYRSGDLKLEPSLAVGRFTLHPRESD